MSHVLILKLVGIGVGSLDLDTMPSLGHLAGVGLSGTVDGDSTADQFDEATSVAPGGDRIGLVLVEPGHEPEYRDADQADLLAALCQDTPGEAARSIDDATLWTRARQALAAASTGAVLVLAPSAEAEPARASTLDRHLAELLDSLGDETAVLILFVPPRAGGEAAHSGEFLLVDPQKRAVEPEAPVRLVDLVATVFSFCGYGSAASLGGRSLTGPRNLEEPVLTAEQEEILRERLSGLGYLG
jgi:hypothetical protein